MRTSPWWRSFQGPDANTAIGRCRPNCQSGGHGFNSVRVGSAFGRIAVVRGRSCRDNAKKELFGRQVMSHVRPVFLILVFASVMALIVCPGGDPLLCYQTTGAIVLVATPSYFVGIRRGRVRASEEAQR